MSETIERTDYPKIISSIATLLLCAGIISQTVYYFFFNIPITEFLTLSEVLLLFTQDVIRYILIFLLLLFISIVFSYSKPSSRHKRFFIEYTKTEKLSERAWKYASNSSSTIIYYLFGFITFFLLLKEGAKVIFLFGLGFSIEVIYFFIRFFILENRRTLRIRNKLLEKDKNLGMFFTFGLHFVFFVVCWSLVDVQKVKYEQKFINISFKLKSDTLITSDSTKYYIGQTDKFLFYYDSKRNVSTVFKKEDVKELHFGKINYWQTQPAKK